MFSPFFSINLGAYVPLLIIWKALLSPIRSCFIHHGVIHLKSTFIHHTFIHLSKFFHSSFFHQTFIHLSCIFLIIHASFIEILFCQLSFVTYSLFFIHGSFNNGSTIFHLNNYSSILTFIPGFSLFFFINHASKIFIHLEFYFFSISICPMFIYHPSIIC